LVVETKDPDLPNAPDMDLDKIDEETAAAAAAAAVVVVPPPPALLTL
jgi:hypothetical protein